VARRDAPERLGSVLQRAVLDDRFWITPIVRMEIIEVSSLVLTGRPVSQVV
jgi:hypothetical protein